MQTAVEPQRYRAAHVTADTHGPSGRTHADGTPRQVKLSILMPAYNEERTICDAVTDVLETSYPCDFELIVIDDGSSDRSPELLAEMSQPGMVVLTHPRNRGKGAALQTGAAAASGTHLVPFDADLEYDASDLPVLMAPVIQGRCDVVYGTRLFGANTSYLSYRHAMGNRALTLAANLLFDAYLSDMHTCLKLIPVPLFRELGLVEDGFGLDTEITAKVLKRGIRPFEIPVTYHSRSLESGKKITWRDGVQCLNVLARVRGEGLRPVRGADPPVAPVGALAGVVSVVHGTVPPGGGPDVATNAMITGRS